ncbi:MAG: hypothetical protein ACHQF2_03390 [Flavobacteriales bacterium]
MNFILNFSSVIKIGSGIILFLVSTASAFSQESVNNIQSQACSFRENLGQVRDQANNSRLDILYYGEHAGLSYYLKENGLQYQLGKTKNDDKGTTEIYRIDVGWVNARKKPVIIAENRLSGYENYYNVPAGFSPALFVKKYGAIIYKNLYEGIDMKFYSNEQGELEYDFLVSVGANYNDIQIEVGGADLRVNSLNELILSTPLGEINEGELKVFQNGKRLPATWKIVNHRVSFVIDRYNPTLPLLIDPVVRTWGTYYGGNNNDLGLGCAFDKNGNVFLSGYAQSTNNIATIGAHQITKVGSRNAFLVKFDSTGACLWGTYYGGDNEYGYSCATDSAGSVYMAGSALSTTGISTPTSHQPTKGSGLTPDAFLVKFNPNGVRIWGTYYGSGDYDEAYSCVVDKNANVYIAGYTGSLTAISTAGTHQPSKGGGFDAFVAKFDSSGTRIWGTYYGGMDIENGFSCCVDDNNNVFLCGDTKSSNAISTVGSHQPSPVNVPIKSEGFLVKFNSNAIRQWATYYGGNEDDIELRCSADSSGEVYICGRTFSTNNIASPSAHQTTITGSECSFLAKFNPSGVRQWGTYYAASVPLSCSAMLNGDVYVCGIAALASTGITTADAHQVNYSGGSDSFLAKFTSGGVFEYGTYYGGVNPEQATSVQVSNDETVYMAGHSNSTINISTPGSHQPAKSSLSDAFLVKFKICTGNSASVSQTGDTLTASTVGASYQWIDCNNGFAAIPGEINQSFMPAMNGDYAVIVTLGCADTSSCYQVTGIGFTEYEKNLYNFIYPNPNTGRFTIQCLQTATIIRCKF